MWAATRMCMFLWRHPGLLGVHLHAQGHTYVDMCHRYSAIFCFLDSVSHWSPFTVQEPDAPAVLSPERWSSAVAGGQAARLRLDSALHSLRILGQVP